mmetsp:Transcript_19858/g.59519  ORF Transcript_19858/g.59519 Transcript_19858/m.59519 type:complete len:85 (-) Transcript_19858:65-319(-)
MGVPQGFMAHGLLMGTIAYAVLGVVATVISQTCFTKETNAITKTESRRLALVVVWGSVFCMWVMWACVYMHQMVPLMAPEHTIK